MRKIRSQRDYIQTDISVSITIISTIVRQSILDLLSYLSDRDCNCSSSVGLVRTVFVRLRTSGGCGKIAGAAVRRRIFRIRPDSRP